MNLSIEQNFYLIATRIDLTYPYKQEYIAYLTISHRIQHVTVQVATK